MKRPKATAARRTLPAERKMHFLLTFYVFLVVWLDYIDSGDRMCNVFEIFILKVLVLWQ